MQKVNLLEYRRYRYLKGSLLLSALAILAYSIHHPNIHAFGGTWLGYTLGFISTAIIIWLLGYSFHKRMIPPQTEPVGIKNRKIFANLLGKIGLGSMGGMQAMQKPATLQGWLSAHVYFGLSLVVLVTLHTGFRIGWNIHSFAYVLMLLVIITGIYGTYSYIRFPYLISANLGNETRDDLILQISELDEQAFRQSLHLTDEIRNIVLNSKEHTKIGGSLTEQLSGEYRKQCPTHDAIEKLCTMAHSFEQEQFTYFRNVHETLVRKELLLKRARTDVMFKAKMDLWSHLHIPLAISFFTALLIHIFSIYFFW